MAQVEAFRFKEDQKRALVSRLLQRQCVSAAMGIAWESVLIKRTKGRKPFATNKGLDRSQAPNFNFNVSHEVRAYTEVKRSIKRLIHPMRYGIPLRVACISHCGEARRAHRIIVARIVSALEKLQEQICATCHAISSATQRKHVYLHSLAY